MSQTKYLWKVEQHENTGYDTYSDFICCAATENDARKIHPSQYEDMGEWWKGFDNDTYKVGQGTWASNLLNVCVRKIGVVTADIEETIDLNDVLCASFHAG